MCTIRDVLTTLRRRRFRPLHDAQYELFSKPFQYKTLLDQGIPTTSNGGTQLLRMIGDDFFNHMLNTDQVSHIPDPFDDGRKFRRGPCLLRPFPEVALCTLLKRFEVVFMGQSVDIEVQPWAGHWRF
ncbi:hypothetical protein PMG11_10153 [Penicillium brasilianum]|uniref:Uncharacterized protein n=1 Tax=Penicillium brasilianum TaxID=104259 RepID=A0A0F7U1W9_PENBI|nr:hypothetical protein PMG11_10153 [Penicillium brasilianum]